MHKSVCIYNSYCFLYIFLFTALFILYTIKHDFHIYIYIELFWKIVVERYDPRLGKWFPMAPMSTRRKHLGCAVYNNMIYAVGGRDDCMELSSAERYNPHTNSWSPIVAMTSRRSGVGYLFIHLYVYSHIYVYPIR